MSAVKRLRSSFGETQEAFAARLGVNVSSIIRWENRVPPANEALPALIELSESKGLENEAAAFRTAHESEIEQLGPIAQAVRAIRSRLKLSQQQFADRIGVSLNSIWRYENDAIPEPGTLKKLAELARENTLGNEASVLQRHKLLSDVEAFLSKADYEDVWVLANLFDFIARGEIAESDAPPPTDFKDLPGSELESSVNRMLKNFGAVGPLEARERALKRVARATHRVLGAVKRLNEAIDWETSLVRHLIMNPTLEEEEFASPGGTNEAEPLDAPVQGGRKIDEEQVDPIGTQKAHRQVGGRKTRKKVPRKR